MAARTRTSLLLSRAPSPTCRLFNLSFLSEATHSAPQLPAFSNIAPPPPPAAFSGMVAWTVATSGRGTRGGHGGASWMPWCLPFTAALAYSNALAEAEDTAASSQTVEEQQQEVISNIHTARWRVFTDTGRDLFSQGRTEEAERYFTRAVEEAKQGFGSEDPHVASACNNLAELYRVRKEYDRAEGLYNEAIQRLKAAMGPQHYSVGLALHNLGGFYLQQRRYEDALKCYEEALKIKEESLGPQHPECATTMFHLGEVLRLLGRVEDAETLIRSSLKVLEEGGGGHTVPAVRRTGRLAEILAANGQLEEAESLQRKVLHIVETVQGVESSAAISAAESLAATLRVRGKLEEAKQLMERCLRVRIAVLGGDHPQVGSIIAELAQIAALKGGNLALKLSFLEAMEEYQRAAALCRRAIRIADKRWQQVERSMSFTDPRLLINSLVALARPLVALGETLIAVTELPDVVGVELSEVQEEAEGVLRRCLNLLCKEGLPPAVVEHVQVKKLHLACLQHLTRLMVQKRKANPEKYSDEAVEALQKQTAALETSLPPSTFKPRDAPHT